MRLSVLTIVKDRPGHLAQLVEGLRRSAVPPDELIIIDMASRIPVTIEKTSFPSRIIRLDQPGLPLAAARNAAARSATGDMLLFLDVDCIPMRGLVGAMKDILRTQDALICAPIWYLGPDDARGEWEEHDLIKRASGHAVRQFPTEGFRRENNAGLFWSLAFGMYRQRFFDLKGFDEAFTGYGAEDTDFGFRADEASVPLLFMGGAGAFHQYHDIFDPPLQHLDDILRNADIFRQRWGIWPMEGWLAAFENVGLISRRDNVILKLRSPSPAEIEEARVMSCA